MGHPKICSPLSLSGLINWRLWAAETGAGV